MFRQLKHLLIASLVALGALQASGQIAMPDNVCVGAEKNYWVDATPGSVYNWTINGVAQPTTGNLISIVWDTPGNYLIRVQEESADGCLGPIQEGEVNVNENLPVSVDLVVDQNPVCLGNSVIFTATPANGGTNPVFSWFVNGIQVQVGGQPDYTYEPAQGDQVQVELLSDEACATGNPAQSGIIEMNVDPILEVWVSITASVNPVCQGAEITFTASAQNEGSNPVFTWFVNGIAVQAGDADTYTYVPANGDQVYVELLSDFTCTGENPVTSNVIDVTVEPLLQPAVTIVVDNGDICAGSEATFTALPVNGGPSPYFTWLVNGVADPLAHSDTYIYTPANNDQVEVEMVSDAACVQPGAVVSNEIIVTVNQPAVVTLHIDADANPVCAGSEVTFTTQVSNPGPNPEYSWWVDGVMVPGETAAVFSFVPVNGQQVQAVVLSDDECVTGNPASSNTITMLVNDQLEVQVAIAANATALCAGEPAVITASPVNGGSNPQYAWYVNSVLDPLVTGDTYTYTPANGDEIYVELTSSESCTTNNPAVSNEIVFTVNEIPTLSAIGTNALNCGEDGSIEFAFTNVPDGTYDINYATGSFTGVAVIGGIATVAAAAGQYDDLSITVGLCTSVEDVDITITAPEAPTLAAVGTNALNCGEYGSIEFTFTNVPDGTYDIDYATGSFTGVTVTGGIATVAAAAGQYDDLSITVGLCTSVEDVDIPITAPEAPTLAAVGTNALNCGEDGSIDFTFTNVPDGTYDINYATGSFTGVAVTGGMATVAAAAGQYDDLSITVGLCTSVEDVDITITAPGAPTLAAVGTNALNCGEEGSIDFAFTNVPDGTYDINYATGSFTGVAVTGGMATVAAAAGQYDDLSITVGPCTSVEDVDITITAPEAPTLAAVGTNALNCGEDGSIDFTFNNVPDGTYDINYATGSFTGVAVTGGMATVAAAVGQYDDLCITVGLCTSVEDVDITITAPEAPEIAAVSSTNETCGNGDGSISITATGNGALEYSIDGGANWSANNVFNGLSAGSYAVMVRDANACSTTWAENPVVINNVGGPDIASVVATNETCGNGDGSISITATGNGALEYSIDGGANWSANNVFNGLSAGSYAVMVRDANACSTTWAENPVVINSVGGPDIASVVATNETCGNGDGSISITATGNGALEYSIDGGANWSVNNVFNGLSAGSYIVMVRDANACSTTWAENPVVINNVGGPDIASVVATDETCGNGDGSISITATGNGALEYSIDGGANWSANNVFNGLSAGSYTVMVRDANACSTTWAENPVVINNVGGPDIASVVATDETCGNGDGSISITATGNGALEYSIDGGANWSVNNVFNGLSAGSYTVMVRDESTCSVAWNNNPVFVDGTPGIDDLYAEVINATNGQSNGSVRLVEVGGTAPFEYQVDGLGWQMNDSIGDLSIGPHIGYVRDANGCEFSVSFTIGNVVVNDIEFGVDDQVFCLNIPIEIPIEARNFIDVVSVRIELTFDNTILTFDQVVSNTPGMLWSPQLNASGNVLTLRGSIYSGTITVPGGSTLFTLSFIGNSAGISSLQWNTVEYVIYSGDGYTVPALFVQGKSVEVLPAPQIAIEGGGTYCEGDSTRINVTSSDGNPIAVQWVGPDGFNTTLPEYAFDSLTMAQGGLYTVAATNNENCSDTKQLSLQVNPSPQVKISYESDILCAGIQHLLDAGSGYTSYTWQDGSPLQTYIARDTGVYSVRVFNAYGCPGEAQVTLIPCTLSLSIPNAFTPITSSGLNDVFKPVLTGDVVPTLFFMQIYNKWGQKIFETNDYDKGWDGTVNGVLAPSGVYSYVISFAVPGYIQATADSPVTGSVTLLR